MSLTAVLWLLIYVVLAVLAFVRPAYGIALYLMTFYASPAFWWWGGPLADLIGTRINLFTAFLLAAAVLSHSGQAPIEGGPDSSGDRHVIVLDRYRCELYELFYAFSGPGSSWRAASGARYHLDSSALRPDGWTSADAAGLPIYPGLVRYPEVASGRITHAIRFTAPQTQAAHVWPARHDASRHAQLLDRRV